MTDIDSVPHSPETLTGRLLGGRYLLTHPLASGGMAEVWQADDTVLQRRVAVKILHKHLATDPVFVERFRSEARLAARLSHPGIVAIFDTVSEPGIEAIVMELLEGVDLRSFLDEHGALSAQVTRDLGAQVADAIQAAHTAGLVHRDIKPGNIMLVDDRRMKVTDFGIAKPSDGQDLTDHGTLLGTAKYLAPEQVEGGQVDGRADVYALGVVLFECLTGTVPFSGDTNIAVAMARLQREPPHTRNVRSTIPPSLDAVVYRSMAREAEQRFATAADMRAALLAADDATVLTDAPLETTVAPPEVPPAQFIAGEGRWIVPAVLILVMAVGLAVAGTLIGTTEVGRDAFTRAREAVGLSDEEPAEPEPGEEAVGEPDEGGNETADEPPETPRIVAISTFDPEGTGEPGENDADVRLAVDGDPTTVWTTEGYDSRDFGGLKSGVGVIVELNREVPLGAIEIRGPSVGWAADVYLASTPSDTLEGWGDPVSTAVAIDQSVRFDLGAPSAGSILIWITDLGDAPPRLRVEISEITLFPG